MSPGDFEGFLSKLSGLLNLSSTERDILHRLLKSGEKLQIDELVDRLERSERAVRGRIKSLYDMGLVRRELISTESGQRAYRYFVVSLNRLRYRIREEVSQRLSELEGKINDLEE